MVSYEVGKIYRLCEKHFNLDDINITTTSTGIRKTLKLGAIPMNENDKERVIIFCIIL